MADERKKSGINKGNVIIGVILLALVGFIFGTDALEHLDAMQVKLIIGLAVLLVIVISVRSINQKRR